MRAQAMYHLDLDAAAVQGAQLALLPGDPFRSRMIADRIATLLVTDERSVGIEAAGRTRAPGRPERRAGRAGVGRLVFAHIGRPTIRALDRGLTPPFGEFAADGQTFFVATAGTAGGAATEASIATTLSSVTGKKSS